jgi:two-component system NtrC family sensor kinase
VPLDVYGRLLNDAQLQLAAYDLKREETLHRSPDPSGGFNEAQYVEMLGQSLHTLQEFFRRSSDVARANPGVRPPGEEPQVKEVLKALRRTNDDLWDQLVKWQGDRILHAKDAYRASLETVIGVGVGGTLLLCGLLRSFYVWVFYPIRDLERGAGRVAHGDFDFRLDVHSGDEMEDLAGAFNNMTERLSETYQDVQRQVNDRSRQLVRSERLASVGFLAAGVAHEINNPLASIAFCSEALEQRLKDQANRDRQAPEAGDDETITKYLRMIQEEAFRCKAITQRLLEFSRGGERVREPSDLSKVVQSVVDMVEHLETSHGKKIVFQPSRRVVAWVNAQEIKSVILNLVVNALESMDEGGELRIQLAQRAGTAVLEFTDSGCGMTPETLENIFEPFYTRSRTGKGTGLGLSISHRVINQHGGEIEAVSPGPNQGSTFTVRLPLQPADSVEDETLGNLAA